MEHRRLAVDLSEVIVKWESQRIKEESEENSSQVSFCLVFNVQLTQFSCGFLSAIIKCQLAATVLQKKLASPLACIVNQANFTIH